MIIRGSKKVPSLYQQPASIQAPHDLADRSQALLNRDPWTISDREPATNSRMAAFAGTVQPIYDHQGSLLERDISYHDPLYQ